MPELDTRHEVTIPSPTTRDTVITNPKIPGLELHLPKGTVIRDDEGKVVRKIGITPIPIDRPPFPLPMLGVDVPTYFTIQPGGAYVYPKSVGARIVYPNYNRQPAGQQVEFYSYDPEGKGWHVYGQGHVTKDRRQVVPDRGTSIYEFSGAMFNGGNTPPPTGPAPGSCSQAADPVDCSTGLFLHSETDLSLPDVMPIDVTRTYRPNDTRQRAFGVGTTLPFDMFLWSRQQYREVDLILPDGGRVHFARTSPGTSYSDAVFESTNTPTQFYKAVIRWESALSGWRLTLKDGTSYEFRSYQPVSAIRDRFGNRITINRDGNRITQITSPHGRWISFVNDSSGRIIQARDNIGRTVKYAYDSAGRLVKVTNPTGGVTAYTYDSAHRMLTVTNPRKVVATRNAYDSDGRVATQTLANKGVFKFAYTVKKGRITQTIVTDPRGVQRRVTFDTAGYPVTDTSAFGRPQAQVTTVKRAAASHLPTQITDQLGRRTTFTYDARGNPTAITRLAGSKTPVTTKLTYNAAFSQVTSVTNPLNHTANFSYDARGALTAVTDALKHRTTVVSDGAGRPTEVTDPVGSVTRLGYAGGDLLSVTDPLGRTTRQWVDPAGRPLYSFDANGNVSTATYDNLNRLTSTTDALRATSKYTYDPRGNLTRVTDPRGGVTRYGYDGRDQVTARTDPLGRVERTTYDRAGNPTAFTDRRGIVATYTYDALERLTKAAYGTSRTDQYVYDAADRLTAASSKPVAISGTLSRAYDTLDRLVSERSAQGKIAYSYDKADRRVAMTIAGQPRVTYAYDNANALVGITRGADKVAVTRDAASRQTAVSLPNGVKTSFGYNQASQITSQTFTRGATNIGAINYTFDQTGRRQGLNGTLATVRMPAAVPSASYDDANQLTRWGSTAISYDRNGNMTRNGTQTYTWSARNELAKIGGVAPSSFAYDPVGRRTQKTIGATSTRYLYDGQQPMQELTGKIPKATMLTGLGLDENYGRYEGSNASYYLTDSLGSTVALTSKTGAVSTRYEYQPYGVVARTGAASTNPYQFTGRENDGTGLYNYRARYYSPRLQRFLSEDPVLSDGRIANLYSYVDGDPVNMKDPTGKMAWVAAAAFVPGLGQIILIGAVVIAAGMLLQYALSPGASCPTFMSNDARPGNNRDQNRQVDQAIREYERKTGNRVNNDDRERLHEELHERGNNGYHDIGEALRDLFGSGREGSDGTGEGGEGGEGGGE